MAKFSKTKNRARFNNKTLRSSNKHRHGKHRHGKQCNKRRKWIGGENCSKISDDNCVICQDGIFDELNCLTCTAGHKIHEYCSPDDNNIYPSNLKLLQNLRDREGKKCPLCNVNPVTTLIKLNRDNVSIRENINEIPSNNHNTNNHTQMDPNDLEMDLNDPEIYTENDLALQQSLLDYYRQLVIG